MPSDTIVESIVSLSEQIDWRRLSPEIQNAAKRELLDILGDMVAGHALLGMPPWLEAAAAWSGSGPCAVVDGTERAPAAAVLINGYFTHALELDDTHDDAVLHAGASAIPAALAACDILRHEGRPVSGERFLEAMILGIDVSCRLGIATDLNLVDGGWIYSALLGHFGAAAAAARVLSDDPDVLRSALGAAYTLTSGNHQSTREGAETKALQPAIAGSNGLLAALMARGGLTGVAHPFLGEDGLGRGYLHGKLDPGKFSAALGASPEIARLSFKPYPSCRLTHPAITAALDLHRDIQASLDDETAIELRVNPQAFNVVGKTHAARMHPEKRLDAQLSIYWCTAVALVHGEVLPDHLVSEVPPSPAVASWIDRIRCSPMEDSSSRDIGGCTLTATGGFGMRTITVGNAKGHPDNPVSDAELERKFAHNAGLAGLTPKDAKDLAARIWAVDKVLDAASLLRWRIAEGNAAG
jgi:2-methylcitrate dehydratase PrpD